MKKFISLLVAASTCVGTFAANNKLSLSIPEQTDAKIIKVVVSLDNEEEFQGLEMNVSLPAELGKSNFIVDPESDEYFVQEGGRFSTTKMPITTGFKASTPNNLFVSIVAVKTTTFSGNSGSLGYFSFDASSLEDGEYEVSFDDSFLIIDGDNSVDGLSGKVSFKIKNGALTSVQTIPSNESAEKVNVYDILGHAVRLNVDVADSVEGLEDGVYIVNGKKVVVTNK